MWRQTPGILAKLARYIEEIHKVGRFPPARRLITPFNEAQYKDPTMI
jgi:hypothetical protein